MPASIAEREQFRTLLRAKIGKKSETTACFGKKVEESSLFLPFPALARD